MKQKMESIISLLLRSLGLSKDSRALEHLIKQKESIIILLFITLIMLLLEYFGWQRPFLRLVAPKLSLSFDTHTRLLYAQGYTTFSFWLLFIISPSLLLCFLPSKENQQELGLGLPKKADLGPYLFIAIGMFIALIFVCSSSDFYRFYPLFRPHGLQEWLIFEAIYLAQFVAVEFFFRGPLLFRLNQLHGPISLFIMTLPYALIHIHKPFPEALGSIIAGVILGLLSLKSKSLWPGVLLHMFIALSADSLGLFYGGDFTRW